MYVRTYIHIIICTYKIDIDKSMHTYVSCTYIRTYVGKYSLY